MVAIWKSVIPELNEQTATALATDYDLSGGQIENISRKTLIDQLISGSAPSREQLRQLCEQEKLQKDGPKRILSRKVCLSAEAKKKDWPISPIP